MIKKRIKNRIGGLLSGASGDSFMLVFVRIVTLVFGLLMTRVLSGHFSVHDYGTYSQVLLVSTTATTLTVLGMSDGINYFFCKTSDVKKRDAYVSTIFCLQGIVGILTGVVILLCAVPLTTYFGNSDVKELLLFSALLPVMQNMLTLLQIIFLAIGKAKHIAVRNLLVSILKLAAIFVACYVFDTIVVVLVCQVLLELAQLVYFYLYLKKNQYFIRVRLFDAKLIREILSFCIPMAMFTVIKALNRDCDKYVISAFTDTETLAVYTNASKQLPFDLIMTSFITVLQPFITRGIAEKKYALTQNLYKSFLELSIVCTTTLAMGAILVSPELLSFLYTEKYMSGLSVFVLYILVDILSVFGLTLLLSAAGKTKTIMYVAMGAFVTNLVLNVLFYKLMGFVGPAVATLVVTVIQGVALLSYSARLLQTRAQKLFDIRYMCLFLLELVVAGGITLALRKGLVALALPEFVMMCGCYAFFVILVGSVNFKKMLKCIQVINAYKTENT